MASDLANVITAALEQRTPTLWWRFFSYAYHSSPARTSTPATRTTYEQPKAQRTSGSIESITDEVWARRFIQIVALRDQHPPPDSDEPLLQLSDTDPGHLEVSKEDVLAVLHSFSPGSATGLDDIRSKYLRLLMAKNNKNS